MASTLVGQTAYTFGLTDPNQTQTIGGSLYTYPQTVTYPNSAPQYIAWPPVPSEAEKAGKALAIMKELEAEGLIAPFESVAKFCEMIDKIASKL